jgi:hypothetical protein
MTQDAHLKLNPELEWQNQRSAQKKALFHQENGLRFKEETSEVLHLAHSGVWC